MGYTKVKYQKPKDKMLICPKCKSHRIQQKHDTGPFKFWCINCYWHGETPIITDRTKANFTKNINSVSYEEIIKNLLQGKSIAEQYEKFGVSLGSVVDGHLYAARNKVLRVYNSYAEYTGIPSADPNFTKIKVTDDVMSLLISAINDEETKIRDSPRLSLTFSK